MGSPRTRFVMEKVVEKVVEKVIGEKVIVVRVIVERGLESSWARVVVG